MKRKRLMAIALMVAAFMVIASAEMVRGASSRVTYRPLSDWTYNNWLIGAYWNEIFPDGGYFIFGPFNPFTFPEEGTYDGYVKERELNDGRAEITVLIRFRDAKEACVWDFDPVAGYTQIVAEGTATGVVYYMFIIPEPGAEIPLLFAISGEDTVSMHISVSGFGTLTSGAAAFGFTPGATAKVTVVQQGFFDKGSYEEWFYPVEMVNVHEIG